MQEANPFDQFDQANANPFDRFDNAKPKAFIGRTALNAGKSFRAKIDADLQNDIESGAMGFRARADASDEEKHKAYILNQYYDQAGFEGVGVGRFDDPHKVQERKLWAIDQYERNGGRPPERKKMSRLEAASKSMADASLRMPVIGDAATSLIDFAVGDYIDGSAKDQFRDMKREAREAHPMSSLGGDIAGYVAPGAQVFRGGSKLLSSASSKVLAPQAVRALTPTGTSTAAKLGRYVPRTVLPATGAAGADYALYEATIGANNIEADTGEAMSTSERVGRGMEYLNPVEHPEGYAFGAVASPVYRLLRGGVTTTKNTVEASVQAGKPTFAKGTLTPKPTRQQIDQTLTQLNDARVSRDPTSRAYRVVARALDKDQIGQDDLINALEAYRYGGYSTVDEMLFELASAATNDKGAGKINELVRALATVGGDAQSYGRTQTQARAAKATDRIRDDIRKAAGLDGSDFDTYGAQLEEAAFSLPQPLYDEAYSKSISNRSFRDGVLPVFTHSPQARDAVSEAADYAVGVARSERELVVARQTADELARFGDEIDRLRRGEIAANQVGPLSTRAYDYIIRMLGDAGHATRFGSKRTELARGFEGPAYRLRRIVDGETGLGEARRVAAELKAASKALDFGVKAAKRQTALRDIQKEFARDLKRHADSDIDVFEGNTINSALLMGYMRGAEDMIETATNPTTVIRQLYGSQRQREKMKEMLLGLDETVIARAGALKAKYPNASNDEIAAMVQKERAASSTGNSDSSKRLRTVVGDKYQGSSDPKRRYEHGDVRTSGRFDREIRMAESGRDLFNKSPTGRNNAAVAEQGGNQQLAESVVQKLFRYGRDTGQAAQDATEAVVRRVTKPAIYDEAINKELGHILFASGDDQLKAIIDDIGKHRAPKANSPTGSGAGAEPAAAAPLPPQKKAAQNSMLHFLLPSDRTELATTGVGAVSGGTIGLEDYNNDGKVDWRDALLTPEGRGGIVAGAGAGLLGGKGGKMMAGRGRPDPLPRRRSPEITGPRLDDVPEAQYYHGTSRPFDGALDPNAPASSADNMARGGVFMSSNRDVASQYAQGPNARVLPVDPKVKNPMTHDYGGVEANDRVIQRLIDEAKAAGHDSLILRNIKDGAYKDAPVSDVMVVFRGEDAVIVPAPGSATKPGLMDRIAAKGKDSERGAIFGFGSKPKVTQADIDRLKRAQFEEIYGKPGDLNAKLSQMEAKKFSRYYQQALDEVQQKLPGDKRIGPEHSPKFREDVVYARARQLAEAAGVDLGKIKPEVMAGIREGTSARMIDKVDVWMSGQLRGKPSERGSIDFDDPDLHRRAQRMAREMGKATQAAKKRRLQQAHMEQIGENVRAQEPAAVNPMPEPSVGRANPLNSPLGVLLAFGAGGTGLLAHEYMNKSKASTKPHGERQESPFVQAIMRNANTALDDIVARRNQGLPKTPNLKPRREVERTAAQAKENSIQQAIRDENARSQEYWRWLGQHGQKGDQVLWNKIKQKRASELRVTPEDRRNGIRDKRLPYSYEMPVSELENAPIELLVDGEWISEVALRAPTREPALLPQ